MAQTKAQLLNPLNGNVNVSGIVTSGGFKVGTGISIVGSGVAATTFYGDGSQLTGITAGATLSWVWGSENCSYQFDIWYDDCCSDRRCLTYNSTSNTLTATTFSGALTGNVTGTASLASNLTGTPDITVNNIVAAAGTFTGVLTYEDVTNVDSIGVVTARSGIKFGSAGAGGTITADGHAEFVGTCTATKFIGDGSELSGISAGITTTASSPSANTVVTLNLGTAQHHDLTLSAGITTITCIGGNFGESHSLVITQPSSGIATVGFSTYFLFPSGSSPTMSEGSSQVDLVTFVVKKIGATGIGTQLLASAGLNYQ